MEIKKMFIPMNGSKKKKLELSQTIKSDSLKKKEDILDDDTFNKCIKCKSSQNVKLVSIMPRFKGDAPQKQIYLCEDCRKISLKVSILR